MFVVKIDRSKGLIFKLIVNNINKIINMLLYLIFDPQKETVSLYHLKSSLHRL